MKLNILFLLVFVSLHTNAQTDEFFGPLQGWTNIKSYGAVGNGIVDDTQAFQNAFQELSTSSNASSVLYIPPGTYIISSQIVVSEKNGISVFGYHPDSVRIKWVSPTQDAMIYLDGVSRAQFSRITWDGSGTASAAYLHETNLQDSIGLANTATEHSDEFFINCRFGIFSGGIFPNTYGQDSEFLIIRCTFSNCSSAGISIADWNDLDWVVRECRFLNCKTGVTTDWGPDFFNDSSGGTGNFHIYNSIFQNSTDSDIKCGAANIFSIRNNFSTGSRRFLNVGRGVSSNSWLLRIQGNTIVRTTDPESIWMFNRGNTQLIDNLFISNEGQTNPVVRCLSNSQYTGGCDFLSIGNKFTVNNPIAVDLNSRLIAFDNLVLNHCSFEATIPELPGFNPNVSRTIFNVPAGANYSQIQEIINQAYCLNGSKPVIYFKRGIYFIDSTIVIPANSDMQLVGDGFADSDDGTRLIWRGNAVEVNGYKVVEPNIMFRIGRKSHVRFANILLRGRYNYNSTNYGTTILIEDTDTEGNRVFLNQVANTGSESSGLFIDGIHSLRTIIDASNFNTHHESAIYVKGKGVNQSSILSIQGCFGGDSNPFLELDHSAGAILGELWLESDKRFAILRNNSRLSLSSAVIASNYLNNDDFLTFDNTNNHILASQVFFAGKNEELIVPQNSNSKILLLGFYNRDNNGFSLINSSNFSNVGLLNNRYQNSGSLPVVNQGNQSTSFIRDMFQSLRGEQPFNLDITQPQHLTDLRFYRTAIGEGNYNMVISSEQTLEEYSCVQQNSGRKQTTDLVLNKASQEYLIYPNPAHSFLHIRHADDTQEYLKITLLSCLGESILEKYELSNNLELDLSKYPAGIYYIKVESSKGIQSKKLVISK